MKKEIFARLLVIVCFILISIPVVAVTAVFAAQPAPVKITLLTSAFGSGSYTLGSAIEKLTASKDPWLRIICTESPGFAYNIRALIERQDQFKNTIIMAGHNSISMAEKGVQPMFDKPYNVNNLKMLVGRSITWSYLVKLGGPATCEDLDGKKIGLGKAPQTAWSITPRAVLEKGYAIKANYSYLGPRPATQALLDGRVYAAVHTAYGSADNSIVKLSGPVRELEASGRKFSLIGFKEEMIKKASKAIGWKIQSYNFPAKRLSPTWQPNALVVISNTSGFYVHKSFPDDIAYEFTKFAIENYKDVPKYSPTGKFWNLSSLSMAGELEHHPGAIRAFKEKGINLDK